jgi:hypothetical protein
MVIYVPTNPDGTPDVAAALEAVTGMPGGMGLPPGSTLVQNGNEFVVTLNYDPSTIVSSAPTTSTVTSSGSGSENETYAQYTIPEQLQIPASLILQHGVQSDSVTVQSSMVGSGTKLVDVNGMPLHEASLGAQRTSSGDNMVAGTVIKTEVNVFFFLLRQFHWT